MIELSELARSLLALLFVLSLIVLISWAVRRFGLEGRFKSENRGAPRLAVVERLVIDPKRRLVLIRKDDREHLLLLGSSQDVLVESSPVLDTHKSAPKTVKEKANA